MRFQLANINKKFHFSSNIGNIYTLCSKMVLFKLHIISPNKFHFMLLEKFEHYIRNLSRMCSYKLFTNAFCSKYIYLWPPFFPCMVNNFTILELWILPQRCILPKRVTRLFSEGFTQAFVNNTYLLPLWTNPPSPPLDTIDIPSNKTS